MHNTRTALMFATSIDYSQIKRPNNPYYRLMFININGTEIRGIFIHTNQYLTNFVIVLANSVITNRSKIHFYPPLEINGVKKDYVRQLRMTKCSLNNSNFRIIYASANVVIEDSIINNMLPMVLHIIS